MSRSEGIFWVDIDVSSNDLRRKRGVQLAMSEKLLPWNSAFFTGSGPRLVWPRWLVRRTRGMISSCVVHMFFVTFLVLWQVDVLRPCWNMGGSSSRMFRFFSSVDVLWILFVEGRVRGNSDA